MWENQCHTIHNVSNIYTVCTYVCCIYAVCHNATGTGMKLRLLTHKHHALIYRVTMFEMSFENEQGIRKLRKRYQ